MARLAFLVPHGFLFALTLGVSVADAQPSAPIQMSTAGLGQAKFGMSGPAVEQALAQRVSFDKNIACGSYYHATIAGLPGVVLVFARRGDRFAAVHADQPTVVTPSGFRVGGKEQTVIDKFKSDPTYRRDANRHDGSTMEIVLGNARFVSGQGWQGTAAQISSARGVIKRISVGAAAVVLDDEYCA